jgi:hypothetical protein
MALIPAGKNTKEASEDFPVMQQQIPMKDLTAPLFP